jgi:WD repeat-containing protein 68
LTSFDWNIEDPYTIGTSSIDTTCTLWDISKQSIKTQLIAHENEVYDLAFAPGVFTFATAGADGSIRMFDVRTLEHSTILYDNQNQIPFVRLTWNRMDPNQIATVMMDNNKVILLDIRYPSYILHELCGHSNYVNSVSWAPSSR